MKRPEAQQYREEKLLSPASLLPAGNGQRCVLLQPAQLGWWDASSRRLHIGQHDHKSLTLLLGHTLFFAAHFRHTFGRCTWLLVIISYCAAVSSALLILPFWDHFTSSYYNQPRHHTHQTHFYQAGKTWAVGWRCLHDIFILTWRANPCSSQYRRLGTVLSKWRASGQGRLQALKSPNYRQEVHSDTCWHFVQKQTKPAILVEEDVGVGTDLQLQGEGSKNKTTSLQTRELPPFSWMLFVSVVGVTGYYVYPHCYVRDGWWSTMPPNTRKNLYYCVFCKDTTGTRAAWQVHAASSHPLLVLLAQEVADLHAS